MPRRAAAPAAVWPRRLESDRCASAPSVAQPISKPHQYSTCTAAPLDSAVPSHTAVAVDTRALCARRASRMSYGVLSGTISHRLKGCGPLAHVGDDTCYAPVPPQRIMRAELRRTTPAGCAVCTIRVSLRAQGAPVRSARRCGFERPCTWHFPSHDVVCCPPGEADPSDLPARALGSVVECAARFHPLACGCRCRRLQLHAKSFSFTDGAARPLCALNRTGSGGIDVVTVGLLNGVSSSSSLSPGSFSSLHSLSYCRTAPRASEAACSRATRRILIRHEARASTR